MSLSGQVFRGSASYKVDPKSRVSITPDFRPAQGEKVFLLSHFTYKMPVLRVLNTEEYDRRVAIVRNSDKTEKEKTKALGRLASHCHEASINEQGKLLLSKDLAAAIQVAEDGLVWLVGRQSYFEIWSDKNYAEMRRIEMEEDDDDLGIFD